MAYPLEYGDSPDTAAFNAVRPQPRLGHSNVVARDADDNVGYLRYVGNNTYAFSTATSHAVISGEAAFDIFCAWEASGYRLQVI